MTLYGKLHVCVPNKVLIPTPRLDSLVSIYGCTCIHVKVHILLYHHNRSLYLLFILRCSHCGCDLKEDVPEDVGVDMRQLISQYGNHILYICIICGCVEVLHLF